VKPHLGFRTFPTEPTIESLRHSNQAQSHKNCSHDKLILK